MELIHQCSRFLPHNLCQLNSYDNKNRMALSISAYLRQDSEAPFNSIKPNLLSET